MFDSLELAPPDAILGLTEAFLKDPNPEKINLSVGVFKDSNGVTPILKCVKKAEQILVEHESTKSYLGIDGIKEFATLGQRLLFGEGAEVLSRVASIQSPGGTGALRVAADFLKSQFPSTTVWMTTPTWANHPNIFRSAGLKLKSFAYFDPAKNGIDIDALCRDLQKINAGDVVVLHGCCHNPSGADPTLDQWRTIAGILKERKILPLIDFAYQGFADGIEQDAAGLRTVVNACDELLVANSYSKNFGLYRERVGSLTAVAKSANDAEKALSHLKACIRANYSNPPAHGGAIVQTILKSPEHRREWERELAAMRDRISQMRELFVTTMQKYAPNHDFSFIKDQRGMFSFSGLGKEQVEQLRENNSIYIVGSGRINVAGITESNIETLCKAVASVM